MSVPLPERVNILASQVVDSAFHVHRELGPGLVESVYEACLAREFTLRGIAIKRQKAVPIFYKGEKLDLGFRADMIVEDSIILELKAVEELHPVHRAQLMSYMKIASLRLGFLINFNVPFIRNGINRIIL